MASQLLALLRAAFGLQQPAGGAGWLLLGPGRGRPSNDRTGAGQRRYGFFSLWKDDDRVLWLEQIRSGLDGQIGRASCRERVWMGVVAGWRKGQGAGGGGDSMMYGQ